MISKDFCLIIVITKQVTFIHKCNDKCKFSGEVKKESMQIDRGLNKLLRFCQKTLGGKFPMEVQEHCG